MEHDDAVYREFRARYGPLLERLNDVEWTRREARSRMLTVHPEMDHELLDRALAEMSWRSELRREDPLGGVVISCSLLLAVNDLFDLGEDPEYAVTLLERAIFQEMSAFMNLHGISDEAAAHILSRLAASNRFLPSIRAPPSPRRSTGGSCGTSRSICGSCPRRRTAAGRSRMR
ncbi:Uncharacterised protein [Rothia kristinae]|nr:Uncharacterised protein [Rothia kristinae]